jgi:hypothetical protein
MPSSADHCRTTTRDEVCNMWRTAQWGILRNCVCIVFIPTKYTIDANLLPVQRNAIQWTVNLVATLKSSVSIGYSVVIQEMSGNEVQDAILKIATWSQSIGHSPHPFHCASWNIDHFLTLMITMEGTNFAHLQYIEKYQTTAKGAPGNTTITWSPTHGTGIRTHAAKNIDLRICYLPWLSKWVQISGDWLHKILLVHT